MKNLLIILSIVFSLIGIGLLIFFLFLFPKSHPETIGLTDKIVENISRDPGSFIGGVVGVFFTITGSFLLFLTLKYQRDEFKKTYETLVKQQFETTFFNMISMLSEIRNSISGKIEIKQEDASYRMESYNGQMFLHYFLKYLQGEYNQFLETENGQQIKTYLTKISNNKPLLKLESECLNDEINKIYENCYNKYQSQLGHYFRYIYNLIKFTVDNRGGVDEKKYIDLIQAQLSNDELALIFYNANSTNGKNSQKILQFKLWLENYQFLENLNPNSLLDRNHHVLYNETRFKFLNRDEWERK